MPKPPIPAHLEEMLRRANPAVMATVRRNGSPSTSATWYLWEEGHAILSLDESRKRLDHLKRDPRVSITIFDGEQWYRHVTITGRVTDLEPDPDLGVIDRLSLHYLDEPYFVRDRSRYTARVEVSSWHSWGPGQSVAWSSPDAKDPSLGDPASGE